MRLHINHIILTTKNALLVLMPITYCCQESSLLLLSPDDSNSSQLKLLQRGNQPVRASWSRWHNKNHQHHDAPFQTAMAWWENTRTPANWWVHRPHWVGWWISGRPRTPANWVHHWVLGRWISSLTLLLHHPRSSSWREILDSLSRGHNIHHDVQECTTNIVIGHQECKDKDNSQVNKKQNKHSY